MTAIRSLIYHVVFYGLMAVMGILGLPLAIASRRATVWWMRLYAQFVLWLGGVICGLRYEVRGTVPTGDVIVASKHQSFMDILIHAAVLPQPRYVMKKELKWAPIFGFYAMRMGSTPVARGKKGAAVSEMVRSAAKSGQNPGQLVIYPQGTRVAPGVEAPYKIGAGVLYQRFEKTCVPAATNAGHFWGRASFLRLPGLAVVEYLDPIEPGLDLPDFMAQLQGQVEPASDALSAEVTGS